MYKSSAMKYFIMQLYVLGLGRYAFLLIQYILRYISDIYCDTAQWSMVQKWGAAILYPKLISNLR